jgi:integrase
MPRREKGARLYLDPARRVWIVRDGGRFIRTGCAEPDRGEAEKFLGRYIAAKHKPQPSADPMIADVLNVYAKEHLPHTREAVNAAYHIEALAGFWAFKRVSQISARECRAFTATQTTASARRYLETLRAAVRYWHREYGPLHVVPMVTLPERSERRQRWLDRSEAARLLWAARRTPHLARFILLGLYTGSRSGVILRLQWDQIDLSKGVMARTRPEMPASKTKRAPVVKLGVGITAHLLRWQRLDSGLTNYVCHYNGQPIRKLRRSWAAARIKAGLDTAVTPHALRHTRATWLMQGGISIWEAAGHLGMSPDVLQRVYGHHHPEWQKNASEI